MLKKTLIINLLFAAFGLSAQTIGDSLHAVHYDIHLTNINLVEHTLTAHTTVELVPLSDDISGLSLQLVQFDIDSVFVGGEPNSFAREDGVITIPLAESISPGDTIEATVYYHGQPFHEAWGGFHFAGDYAFNLGVGFVSIPHNLGKAWFPCIDDFTDRATYDLFATVENTQTAIGGGLLMEINDNGDGTSTWHWRLNHNIPTYLESLMVGDYVLVEDEYFGIEDTLPISIYSRPQDTADVAGSFLNLKEITLFFENHFGAYPFERIGFTGTSLGAMEHATNVSYPYSGFTGNTSQEWWYTHELSHMWFGDKVTCATAEEMWMNEGWATFCQIFYLEGLYSHEDFLLTMRDKHKEVLQKTHIVDNGYYALNDVPQEYTYGSTSYDKGATVVNAMRTYLGEDVFYDAITAFLQTFAYQSVSSEEMRDFLTDYTGVDMTGFFDAWVFTPGTPHYSIDSAKYADGQMDIWVKQKFKGYDFIGNHNIVQIAYLKNDFELLYDTLVFDGKTGHSVKQLSFEPLDVLVDPAERMMDATIDNYKVFDEAQDYIFPDTYFKILISEIEDSAFIQATHNWVYADSLKNPDPDITLSPTRYWEIDGYFPEGMQAGGRFYYDNGTTLDGELINSPSDSVVILFRESAADDWHSIGQNRMGIWSVGYIFVDELMKGEYTLAVYNLSVGEMEQEDHKEYKVYPNPSKGELNVVMQTEDIYNLKLYDVKGSLIDSLAFNKQSVRWRPRLILNENGTYLLFIHKAGNLIGIEKIVFIK